MRSTLTLECYFYNGDNTMIDKSKITYLTTSIRNFVAREITAHANTTANNSTKGHVKAGGVPQSIGTTLSAGTDNGYYARADHIHTASYNNLTDKPTIPVASSTVPLADTNDGSIGSSDNWAKADHTHPISPLYATPNHTHSNHVNISDVSSLYLSDEHMPNGIRKDCTHSVTYDKSTGFTRIRVNEGNTSNTAHGYYLTIPFGAPSNNFSISVDFYTTGMSNDDFGIRVCDKTVLDSGGGFNSYGSWIITGQGRLAYGYGGFETSNVKYGDQLGRVENNIQYRYTFRLTDTQAYYCLTNLSTNAVVSEKTYNRTDSYSFSGSYYFYIGTAKFSNGSADKSVYFKNLTIQENCMNPYPIGAIYMSTNSTNPSTLFGGTWEQIKDRFLLAAGDTYSNGTTGGESSHTLTVNEMPNHNHRVMDWTMIVSAGGNTGSKTMSSGKIYHEAKNDKDVRYVYGAGGGQAHNNMPPYLTLYMWKRIG